MGPEYIQYMRFDVIAAGIVALIVAGVIPIVICLSLFKICRRNEGEKSSKFIAALSRLDFAMERFGGGFYTKLILVSCLGLFLEMLLIRWISSEIRVFAYYKNFVLIACYLGFGIGCYLSKRKIHLSCLAFPLLTIALIVGLPWPILKKVYSHIVAIVGAISSVDLWFIPTFSFDKVYLLQLAVALFVFVVPLFALVVFTFIPVGQMVGGLLEQSKNGVKAYSINVLASLVGISLYTFLCFISQPPPVWFVVAALLTIALVWKLPVWRWIFIAVFAIVIAAGSWTESPQTKIYWSPYQKLEITPVVDSGETVSYSLRTNGTWYQHIINLSNSFLVKHPTLLKNTAIEYNPYNIPYHCYANPPSVLILGSGMGNDVAAALRNGAQRVVAVEIDPVIIKLGKKLHFEKPYSDARVTVINDDARSYIQKSKDRFSLIVFSLLDAHTTSSNYSNIRIDNYVYTVEAMQAAKKLLNPDGIFIIKFQVNTPWIAGRLHRLVTTVFEQTPLYMQSEAGYSTPGRFFIAGSRERIAEALKDSTFKEYVRVNSQFPMEKASLTTDDWPFFYQHEPGIPSSVIILSLVLFGFTWLLLRKLKLSTGKSQWHFFFLGAGFMLLEVQVVSKMALLYGTTWMVNSIVVSGILLLIVGANMLVGKFRNFPLPLAYAGIVITMALSFIIPLRLLFIEPAWLKGVIATGLLLSPVFFASIVFIRSFAAIGFKGEALGANLLGALAGGLLESISLWTGLRSLLVIALIMYLMSALTLRAGQRSSIESAQMVAFLK